MCLIEFLTLKNQLELFPHPFPANRSVPEWFKAMSMDNGSEPTVKRCPPFLEAMIAGYMIPAPCDIEFTVTPDAKMTWTSRYKVIEMHTRPQYAGAPFENNLVLKFKNPWVIRTPPGYCTLITAPMNRADFPFIPLAGIVETAAYYREVHIPMISIMRPGTSFVVERGVPMAQMIPFKQDEWVSEALPLDRALRDETEAKFQANAHEYKEQVWKKLQYD